MEERAARALDAEILGIIAAWHQRGESPSDAVFNDLALRVFADQLRHNGPYARYCARLGITRPPASWEAIPAVPAPAFAEAALTTFDPATAALTFETSGTSRGMPGRHFMQTAALYDAALLASFDRFVLRGARLRYLNLVPSPAERSKSSLGYMMAKISRERGCGLTGWYLHGEELLAEAFECDVRSAVAQNDPVFIAATAFALVHLLDGMAERATTFELPKGSRIMTTGGFKGRSRAVEPAELENHICARFGISHDDILSEYGMTELSSQYYRIGTSQAYTGPPWLRTRIVGPERTTLATGTLGSLLHVDLANRSSCVAIQTEDLGMQTSDGLLLLGRDREADLRGCSLDAETLAIRAGGRSSSAR
ncbi:MAG TPA: hypothetical protein VFE16_03365 [Candidatus Cybelea sp.]|nr:hypothetical protein [Candidatus Cybelea sp.]